ncbi:uncharacterized protein DUF1385 [Orenia metallireducens]|uniref:DUF1385 domain-containing protein n=1 Tax=Orenia metallireducens TaxID=1413210 RepID=A0A285IJF1_9FIRM|nr:DUF1385 domain-containing protein [Orenia metallireducens]PRX16642.1 uncharacterized protein DUF1385 [Orenia metallireducens]SNY48088.1 Protein of unknown function [Orenia metallireducens]
MKFVRGMALHNGVEFVSTHKIVTATIDEDNQINTEVNDNLGSKGELFLKGQNFVKNIPFIRGIYDLFRFSVPLLIVFIINILTHMVTDQYYKVTSDPNTTNDGRIFIVLNIIFLIISLLMLIRVMKQLIPYIKQLKRTHEFHGAEHKTIKAYYDSDDLSLESVRKASRVAYSRGTTLFIFWTLCFVILLIFYRDLCFINMVLSYSIAYEIFYIRDGEKSLGYRYCISYLLTYKVCYLLGNQVINS